MNFIDDWLEAAYEERNGDPGLEVWDGDIDEEEDDDEF